MAGLRPHGVHAAAGRLRSGVRRARRGQGAVGRAAGLHRQGRRDRLLPGRRVRTALRAARRVRGRVGQLRRGAQDAEKALAGSCPIVGSFGARDLMGTKPSERLQRALAVLEVKHDVQVYPDSGHRFMSQSSGVGGVMAKIMWALPAARMNDGAL